MASTKAIDAIIERLAEKARTDPAKQRKRKPNAKVRRKAVGKSNPKPVLH